jgi:hypothetical protein
MLDEYLNQFYGKKEAKIGLALPGFRDIYAEAKVRPSYGFLDRGNGRVFERTLDRALKSGNPFVQIATWNDFGEGTTIEPTRDYGYRYLEILQQRARSRRPSFPYQASDLRLPLQIYRLRKGPGAEQLKQKLDRVEEGLSSGRMAHARSLLSHLQAKMTTSPGHEGKQVY